VLPGIIALLLEAAEPTSVAETVLRVSLAERYPGVSRWEIKAFTAQMPTADEVKVVLLGPRSAVQVGRHVYWYSVAGFGRAVSALHAVAPGQPLTAADGRLAESNILAANCEPVRDPGDLSGKRARKILRANEIVCTSAIEPRPLVARGEEVVVRYVGPNVALTINAVAQADGVAGDSLLVLNPHSHDLFRAVVSGAREVTIHE
jgi:flagella basal body P-ring formation protein FlgA